MTREKLNNLIMQACERTWNKKTCKEIEQALSQEPCDTYTEGYFKGYDDGLEQKLEEPCDDAISREAVLSKKIYTETEEGWSGYTVNADYIEQLPSVTQKSGKWIYRREDKYSCSKCGTTTSVDESGIDEKPMYKFCPYCGCRMVEPQESEDKG